MKKRADGRYQKKVTLSDGSIKHVYGTSPAEVNKKVKILEKAFETGVDLSDNTTVGQWAIKFFSTYKSSLKETTRENYLTHYNTHVSPAIGSYRLKDVRPLHIKSIMNSVSNKSESSQKKVLLVLTHMFDAAEGNGLVTSNPVKGIKITKKIAPEKIKFLTDAQQDQLMQNVTDNQARAFCSLCLYAGLRRGEALALQWSDITDGHIIVRQNRTFVNNKATTEITPKSSASYRKIPVINKLQEVLDSTKKRGLTIIANPSSQMLSKTGIRRLWDKVEKSVSFNKTTIRQADGTERTEELFSLHPHMLRHTYCTILYNAGVDLKTAQVLMGHSSISVTAQIYTHIQQQNITDSGQKIDQYLTVKKQRVVMRVVKWQKKRIS